MKKYLTISSIILSLTLFSCASTSPLLDSSKALQSGHILSSRNNAVADDIVCEGKFHPGFLRLTEIPLTNLVPSWWKGKISVNNSENREVEISYLVTRDEETCKPAEMNMIKVKGFDDSYSFPEMKIREPQFSTIIKKDLPYAFTDFSIGSHDFSLLLTQMDEPLIKTDYAPTTLFGLWRCKNQIFSIIDKNNGELCAQFTGDSYTIQKVPSETSAEKLCYAIAVFSIIQQASDREN